MTAVVRLGAWATNFASSVLSSASRLKTNVGMHDAAIGENCRRCEIARTLPGNKPDHLGDLFWPRHASKGDCCIKLGELGWIVHRGEVDRVATAPGPTPTTRMLCLASSTPDVRVSIRMPPLDR